MDKEFQEKKDGWLLNVLRAKYSQCPFAGKILLATKDALLTHWTRGMDLPQMEYKLMQVRDWLQKKADKEAAKVENSSSSDEEPATDDEKATTTSDNASSPPSSDKEEEEDETEPMQH
jgi:hypothetical protein